MKIKKAILLGILMFSVITFPATGLDFGVKGGVGHYSYYGSDYSDILDANDLNSGIKLGLVAGLFATLPIAESISVQPELLIAFQGDMIKEDASVYGAFDGKVKGIDSVPYLSIPVLLKYDLMPLSIFVGPDVLIKVGAGEYKVKATDDTLDGLIGGSADYASDDFETLGIAAVAGFAYALKIGPSTVLLDARVQIGLNNVLNDDIYITELKQYAVILMAGYSFNK